MTTKKKISFQLTPLSSIKTTSDPSQVKKQRFFFFLLLVFLSFNSTPRPSPIHPTPTDTLKPPLISRRHTRAPEPKRHKIIIYRAQRHSPDPGPLLIMHATRPPLREHPRRGRNIDRPCKSTGSTRRGGGDTPCLRADGAGTTVRFGAGVARDTIVA